MAAGNHHGEAVSGRSSRARLLSTGVTAAVIGALVLLGCGSDASEPESPAASATVSADSTASGADGVQGQPVVDSAAAREMGPETAPAAAEPEVAVDEVVLEEALEVLEEFPVQAPVAGARQDEPVLPVVSEDLGTISTVDAAPVRLGDSYQWQDGDRTLEVRLLPDLRVAAEGEPSAGEIVADTGDGQIVAHNVVAQGTSEVSGVEGTEGAPVPDGLPVFLSDSGRLMTLPGGVLIVLDESWDSEDTDRFFADNGIALHRVSRLELTNGFLVDTEPGFASLDLANALAVQTGVELSSPNWWTEQVPR